MYQTKWAVMLISALLMSSAQVQAEESNEKFAKSQHKAPNNTAKNKRDHKLAKPSAQNQGNGKSDIDLTAEVRKSIMAQKGMSIDGQNVKIITKNGVMTLRGPVNTEAEKELIDKLAKESGAKAVTNQLEPKKQ